MLSVTLYKNNDLNQAIRLQARSLDALRERCVDYLVKQQNDVCADFDNREGDLDPTCVLNYCESTKDWEYRDTLDNIDCDSGTIQAMATLYFDVLRDYGFIKGA